MSEFTRIIDLRGIGNAPERLAATPEECTALAARFGIVSVGRLEAEVTLAPEGPIVSANGRLRADFVQSCAVSGEDLPISIDDPIAFRFVPEGAPARPDEEIELEEEDCDEIPYAGTQFDLGEAVAQSLALAIDPYAVGPYAEEARRRAGIVSEAAAGPFAALAALKKDKDKD